MTRLALCALLFAAAPGGFATPGPQEAAPPAEQPTTRPVARITVDTAKAPELAEYGRKVQALADEWYPKIADLLPSDGFAPTPEVTITFTPEYDGVAAAAGNRIVCNPKWFTDHPEDLGAIVHELAHVVQQYGRGRRPGWLVEGIADHVRFYHYEPEHARPRRLDPDRVNYDDSYRVSAAFLEWARATHDPALVVALNAACRQGRYHPGLWRERTGKDLAELNAEWKQSLRR